MKKDDEITSSQRVFDNRNISPDNMKDNISEDHDDNNDVDNDNDEQNDFFKEFEMQNVSKKVKFNFSEFTTIQCKCTAYTFGQTPVAQKCYVCSLCNPVRDHKMCHFCYSNCHKSCRQTQVEIPKSVLKSEKLKPQEFVCFCGFNLKHHPDKIAKKDLASCSMMALDKIINIRPYYCRDHQISVCCICACVCHKTCKIEEDRSFANSNTCRCFGELHTKYNELALNFPLEKYKQVSGIEIWPIQILNILFSTKNTFNKMEKLFSKTLSSNVDFNDPKNQALCDKFGNLLELFSDTFNRKFKTYYYHPTMEKMFEYHSLFRAIEKLKITNSQTALIKFRLVFVLLFVHLRKDFRFMKSLTSIDFLCNSPLDRILFKKITSCGNIFTKDVDKKYDFNDDFPLKKFALNEVCKLISIGMDYLNVEENQDEFEIGLKLLCFMVKRIMFNMEDLDLLIENLSEFHQKFFEYMMAEKNNIYALIEIFNALIELCFMLAVYRNDLIIMKYLDSSGIKKIDNRKIGDFIQTQTPAGIKLMSMILKNCEVFTKHYDILVKPNLDQKSFEEKQRDKMVMMHKMAMQAKILSVTTGVKTKMPSNGGLFTDKIVDLFNESLMMFALADNSYNHQLSVVTKEELLYYYKFSAQIKEDKFYQIMQMNKEQSHSNILLHLKISIEELYYDLFTSSYESQGNLEKKFRTRLLNACDEINKNVKELTTKNYYKKLLLEIDEKENKYEDDKNKLKMDKEEYYIHKLIRHIENKIVFMQHKLIFSEEVRNLIVDNFIVSQVDETLMKGLFFLTETSFPNLISEELIDLIFHFLSIYLTTRQGLQYFLTGKNQQNLMRLVKRFRVNEKGKNINEVQGRTRDFNLRSLRTVLEFLRSLTNGMNVFGVKTMYKHKSLLKLKKNLLAHVSAFAKYADSGEVESEFKEHLSLTLEILLNLAEFFNFEDFEEIKSEVIDVFVHTPFNLLDEENFLKWFDQGYVNTNDKKMMDLRKVELGFYFCFIELITRNTYYSYQNDKFKKDMFRNILKFSSLEKYNEIFSSSGLIDLKQKATLLKFIRTFNLVYYLDQVNIMKQNRLLTTQDYKFMILHNIIKDKKVVSSVVRNDKVTVDNLTAKKYIEKFDEVNQLELLMKIYTMEIKTFPRLLVAEKNNRILTYIKEIVFGLREIGNLIYENLDVVNKILPIFYKLVLAFVEKKYNMVKILNDIENLGDDIDVEEYTTTIKDHMYIDMTSTSFDIFDKDTLYKYLMESIYYVFEKTKINKDVSLQANLEEYDKMAESNFTPFSLIEIKDYEYFYEEESQKEEGIQKKDPCFYKLFRIREEFVNQFISMSTTNFLNVLNGSVTDKKIDFAQKYVAYFQSFINSKESNKIYRYKILLCIMCKMLFYDGEHCQKLFEDMIYDQHFFYNFNRELNYCIVQTIATSKSYFICDRWVEITNITKLTIQFFQLLGEGFNTQFHRSILTTDRPQAPSEKRKKTRDDEDNDKIDSNIQEKLIEESIKESVQNELKKKKEIPVVNISCSVYESIVNNLRRIFHMMRMEEKIEGEMMYDKLCVLTSNMIDFLIEYIETTEDLYDIVNDNISGLFFGVEMNTIDKSNSYNFYDNKGISNIMTMKIIRDRGDHNKYQLRKTMLGYVKLKYFQLLISFLQTGDKSDFIARMIANRLGPIYLFMEIIYYLQELLNSLISQSPSDYSYLLSLDDTDSYFHALIKLYMHDSSFRDSLELAVVFKIAFVLKIMAELYAISALSDHFEEVEKNLKSGKRSGGRGKVIKNEQGIAKLRMITTNQSEEEDLTAKIIRENKMTEDNSLANKEIFNIKNKPMMDDKFNPNIMEDIIDGSYIGENEEDAYQYKDNPNEAVFHTVKEPPYVRILRTYYKTLRSKKLKEQNSENDDAQNQKTLEEKFMNMSDSFSLAVYRFLMELISKIEIRKKNDEDNEDENNGNNQNYIEDTSNGIFNRMKKLTTKRMSLIKLSVSQLEKDTIAKVKKKRKDEQKLITFFIRPYLSYHLSIQTKRNFIDSVDRSTATAKYRDLIENSDYFMFEMIYNDYFISNKKFINYLSNISFYKFEVVSFLFVVVLNILLMYHFYRPVDLPDSTYDIVDIEIQRKRFPDIIVISLLHMIYITFVIVLWFHSKFVITLEKNLMLNYNKNFVFVKNQENNNEENIRNPNIVRLFQKLEGASIFSVLLIINKDIKFLSILYTVFINTILWNREICVFIFTFLLNLLYYFTGNALFMIIPVLFMANIFSFLLGVFRAFSQKSGSIISLLLFTFLITYLYTWITFFYMRELFDFSDVKEYESGQEVSESFCTSSLQCFLILLNYGFRSGGSGIAEILPHMSYKSDEGFYVLRTFYDLTFFIFVVMLMGNLTFGQIIDTFGELRDNTLEYGNDKENVCFICQLTRNDCQLLNIDFNSHIENEHNIWTYVDFLIYLHLSNANDFSKVENSVWERLKDQDFTWLPIEKDVDN